MFDPSKPPATIAEMAQRSFVTHSKQTCLGAKPPSAGRRGKSSGEYSFLNYEEVSLRVRDVAGGLQTLGLERGDRVAILSENRPEWAIFDLACQMSGLISVPLFSTLPASQIKGLLQDCGARVILVSNQSQRKKVEEIQAELPALQWVVFIEDEPEDSSNGPEYSSFNDLAEAGKKYYEANPGSYESMWPAAAPDDVATIIYTSGTTGIPKGVMLTQRNIVANIEAIIAAIKFTSEDVFLSFLPLAHVYERTAGFFLPLRIGGTIAYCESLFTVADNMQEVRPTIMFCVPRLYEAMREKIYGVKLPAKDRDKYEGALALAQKAGAHKGHLPDAQPLGFVEQIKYTVFDSMIYSKIRQRYGGRLRAFVSGGAPMAPELGAFFIGLGLEVLEGYGLTETSPVIAFNRLNQPHLGTVGPPVDSVEVKIAEDGEIVVQGPSVMKGYWQKEAETREVLDEQGWFHTGDLGELDDGYLKITGRKKDLLVLANGKKVAPAPIELKLTQSKFIDQAVLLGDDKKAVGGLIVPNLEAVRAFATAQNIEAENDDALLQTAPVQKLMRREIDENSGELADFEKVRSFKLLSEAFSVEAGEMTPTLKIKRQVVAEKYGSLLD